MNLYDVYLCSSGSRFGHRRQAVYVGDPPPKGAAKYLHTVSAIDRTKAISDNSSVRESPRQPPQHRRQPLETPIVRLPKGRSIVCPVCGAAFPSHPVMAARLHCYTRHGFRFRLADIRRRRWPLKILDGLPLPDLDAEMEYHARLADNAALTDETRTEAFTVLLEAILSWDRRLGRFANYASQAIFGHLRSVTRRRFLPNQGDPPEGCIARSSFWGIGDAEENEDVIDWLREMAIPSLADRERAVILELMGGGTALKAAETLGVSKESARQIKERAFSEIRTMAVRDGLLEAWERDRLDEPMRKYKEKQRQRKRAGRRHRKKIQEREVERG